MLNISFFIATFSSIFWFIFSIKHLGLSTLNNLNIAETYQAISTVLFPIAFIWGLFAIIRGFYAEQKTSIKLQNMLNTLQKNTESTANLCTTLLGTELEIKNGFILQNFDTLISDINEILSDIIKRSNSISSVQMEHLWARTAGGERWLIAKTFIETYSFQSAFADHLIQKASKDSLLKGSILEFQTRYTAIKDLLVQYDKQKIFYNMIEYGALGKVYSLIEPIAQKLLNSKTENTISVSSHNPKPTFIPAEEPLSFPSFFNEDSPSISSPGNTKIEEGLNAIREELLSTPTLATQEIPPAPVITNFDNTQSALQNIKKTSAQNFAFSKPKENKTVISLDELEKEINASPENNYDEYAYPFGAWMNDKTNK